MNGFFHILISKPLFSLKSPTKFEKNTVKPPLTAASQQRPNSLRCFVFGNIIHNFLSYCTFRCFSKIRRNGSHFPWWRSQRKTRRPWVTSSSGTHLRKLDWSPQLMNRSAKCLRVVTSYHGWLICQRVPWLRSTNIFSHHKTNSLVHFSIIYFLVSFVRKHSGEFQQGSTLKGYEWLLRTLKGLVLVITKKVEMFISWFSLSWKIFAREILVWL